MHGHQKGRGSSARGSSATAAAGGDGGRRRCCLMATGPANLAWLMVLATLWSPACRWKSSGGRADIRRRIRGWQILPTCCNNIGRSRPTKEGPDLYFLKCTCGSHVGSPVLSELNWQPQTATLLCPVTGTFGRAIACPCLRFLPTFPSGPRTCTSGEQAAWASQGSGPRACRREACAWRPSSPRPPPPPPLPAAASPVSSITVADDEEVDPLLEQTGCVKPYTALEV